MNSIPNLDPENEKVLSAHVRQWLEENYLAHECSDDIDIFSDMVRTLRYKQGIPLFSLVQIRPIYEREKAALE